MPADDDPFGLSSLPTATAYADPFAQPSETNSGAFANQSFPSKNPVGERSRQLPIGWLIGGSIGLFALIAMLGAFAYMLSTRRPSEATASKGSAVVAGSLPPNVHIGKRSRFGTNSKPSRPIVFDEPVPGIDAVENLTGNERYKRREFLPKPPLPPSDSSTEDPSVETNSASEVLFNLLTAVKIPNRSDMVQLKPIPPEEFRPLPKFEIPESLRPTSLPAWPTAWAPEKALIMEKNGGFHGLGFDARILTFDETDSVQMSDPFPIYKNRTELQKVRRLPASISKSGDLFAFGHPLTASIVEVWSTETQKRVHKFHTGQGGEQLVEWTDFDADGNLLTLEAGTVSSWNVEGKAITGRFAVQGNYVLPIEISPDRRTVFASTGKSLDALDAATGECLARLTYSKWDEVADISFCPDGFHVAVLYRYRKKKGNEDKDRNYSGPQAAVWDLADGTLRVSWADPGTRELCWVSPNHLVFLQQSPSVYDFNLNALAIQYHEHFTNRHLYEASSDGQLWCRRERASDGTWFLTSLSGEHIGEEVALLDSEDAVIDFRTTPVQVVIDLCDEGLAKKHARQLLSSMQRQGWTIGKSNYTIHVGGFATNTGDEIVLSSGKKYSVPAIRYEWSLLNGEGAVIAEGKSGGAFQEKASKYYGGSSSKYPLDFGRTNPVRAIIDEILEKGAGLHYCPITPGPLRLVYGGTSKCLPIEIIMHHVGE